MWVRSTFANTWRKFRMFSCMCVRTYISPLKRHEKYVEYSWVCIYCICICVCNMERDEENFEWCIYIYDVRMYKWVRDLCSKKRKEKNDKRNRIELVRIVCLSRIQWIFYFLKTLQKYFHPRFLRLVETKINLLFLTDHTNKISSSFEWRMKATTTNETKLYPMIESKSTTRAMRKCQFGCDYRILSVCLFIVER